jgi:hypothetical protein
MGIQAQKRNILMAIHANESRFRNLPITGSIDWTAKPDVLRINTALNMKGTDSPDEAVMIPDTFQRIDSAVVLKWYCHESKWSDP